MGRTILDEVLRERLELMEHQLAHAVKDSPGRIGNYTTHLPERRKMMQLWANYHVGLKEQVAKGIPFRPASLTAQTRRPILAENIATISLSIRGEFSE
jgi:hypothetical protein